MLQDWEIDPQVFPTQWAGSQRRVWSYDYVNNYAWFKFYDEVPMRVALAPCYQRYVL